MFLLGAHLQTAILREACYARGLYTLAVCTVPPVKTHLASQNNYGKLEQVLYGQLAPSAQRESGSETTDKVCTLFFVRVLCHYIILYRRLLVSLRLDPVLFYKNGNTVNKRH